MGKANLEVFCTKLNWPFAVGFSGCRGEILSTHNPSWGGPSVKWG